MKTTEQIKQEIVNYLTKTSQHTFIKPKATYNWTQRENEYDYNDFTYFKVIKIEDDFFKLFGNQKSYNLTKIDVDNYIKYYENNSKCVISDCLFSGNKMKSVKSNKYHLGEIEKIVFFLRPRTSL